MFVVELPLSLLLDSLSDVKSLGGFLSIEDIDVLFIFPGSDEDIVLTVAVNVDVDIAKVFLSPSKSHDCSTADAFCDSEMLFAFDDDVDSALQPSLIPTSPNGEACIPSC